MSLIILFALAGAVGSNASHLPIDTPCDIENLQKPAEHNFSDVWAALNAHSLEKDAYESNSEHAQRTEKIIQQMPSAISSKSLCIIPKNFRLDPVTYDPEEQILWVNIFRRGVWTDSSPKVHIDFLAQAAASEPKQTSYIGENAIGVKKKVFKSTKKASYVAFEEKLTADNAWEVGGKYKEIYYSFPIPLSGTSAKELGGRITTVLEYSLQPPYYSTDEDWRYPTVDEPFETMEYRKIISARLLRVVIFSAKSGEKLASFSIPYSD